MCVSGLAAAAAPTDGIAQIRLGVCVMLKKQLKLSPLLKELEAGGELQVSTCELRVGDGCMESTFRHVLELEAVVGGYGRMRASVTLVPDTELVYGVRAGVGPSPNHT